MAKDIEDYFEESEGSFFWLAGGSDPKLQPGNWIQAAANKETADNLQQQLLDDTAQRYNLADEKLEEFLIENYQDEKSKEYLVNGAVLTCTNCTKKNVTFGGKSYYYKGNKEIRVDEDVISNVNADKVLGKLTVTENPKSTINGLCYATIKDRKKENNIPCFGNCKREPDSVAEMKELSDHESELEAGSGTCKYLMKLEAEWENYEIEEPLMNFLDGFLQNFKDDEYGNKSGITMTSMLFCKQGGFIYPVTSGQILELLLLEKDRDKLTDEDLQKLGYLFQIGDKETRIQIFNYLFPMLFLDGSSYGEAELNRHLGLMNSEKIPDVAEKYIQALNALGINDSYYTVEDMIDILSWDQNKIEQTFDACRELSVETGIIVSPILALAIIGTEGTGSYDTNSAVKQYYGNGYGPQHDFEIDTKNGLDLVCNKLSGYLVYGEQYRSAAQEAGQSDNFLITYLCRDTPILGKNYTGVYASDNSWIEVVSEKYQKYSSGESDDARDYIKDYETILSGYDQDLVENKDTVDYEFVCEGGTVVVYEK